MGKRFKNVLGLVISILLMTGLYACGSNGGAAKTSAQNNTGVKKYTKEEIAEFQKAPEKLMKAYYDGKILIGQSITPDRTAISKFYNLLAAVNASPLPYSSEDDFAEQLTSNLKNFYAENGKLIDAKIDSPVAREDGSVDISVTEHYEKQDIPCAYKLIKKDGLWYLSY